MSGLRQTPQQARSAERVQVILGAAERAIAELGYEGATTNHIAAAAGISVGSLYRWFPDKESIATELVRTRLAQVAQHAADAFAEAHDEPTPALVRAVVRAV
ncbi:MAG TPA: TetR family transcriptional regulator, partial [Acidimicrobiaceae bacterium]|nr:TetR family transcriptional regulator [Acidimicrobiaceae bacterium]